MFAPVLFGMGQEWWRNETYSHGFLVPLISGYLAWQKRSLLRAVRRPAPAALVLVFLGLLVQGAGLLTEVEFLPHLALMLSLAGLLLFAWGPAAFRVLLFPYAFLFFMVPWPDTLVEFLSFPMQLLSAKFAAMGLGLLGIPIARDGVDLHSAGYTFSVAAPCSGMRSLVSLLALAALTALLLQGPRGKRLLLFLSGVPLALAGNVLRIMGILLLARFWGPEVAEGFFHKFSGVVVFLIAIAGLLLIGRGLGLTAGRAAPAALPPTPPARPLCLSRFAQVGLYGLALLALGLTGLSARLLTPPAAHIAPLSGLPTSFPGWQSRDLGPLDRTSAEMLQPDAFASRLYRRQDGYPVEVSVVLGHRKQTFHSPGFCLLGGGWNITRKSRLRLPAGESRVIEANQFWLQRQDRKQVVVYWYMSHRETTPNWVRFQYRLLRNRLLGRPESGALVRLTAPVGDSPRAAEQVQAELVARLGAGLEGLLEE